MNKLKNFILSITLFFAYSCYESGNEYTALQDIQIFNFNKENIIADSSTQQLITIHLPGLKAQKNVQVILSTDWGIWPNRSQTITLSGVYNEQEDYFEISTYLIPGRTVQPFTIIANSNGQEVRFNYNSLPRYPDLIQIVVDSLSLSSKLGASTRARAYFYSNTGFPSYGFRFNFVSSVNASIVPLQHDFLPNKQVLSRITLLSNSFPTDTIIVGGTVISLNVQPKILPAKILLKK